MECPVCNNYINGDESFLNHHVNSHYEKVSQQYSPKPSNPAGSSKEHPSKRGAAGNHLETPKPKLNTVLIDQLKTLIESSAEEEESVVYFCHPATKHISYDKRDTSWGCGYHNLQMLLSCLLAMEEFDLNLKSMPDVHQLQQLLEHAWEAGFDTEGAAQLGNHVVGTKTWIGATEVYCILSYLGVRCLVTDFYKYTGENNTHPAVLTWVENYFTSNDSGSSSSSESGSRHRVVITKKPPLYLQHQGHSRTIVGIEKQANGARNLLLFDPGNRPPRNLASVRGRDAHEAMSMFRCSLRQLSKNRQYQIVNIDTSRSPVHQAQKVIRSTRIP
ncbi:DUF1671-domain-containing protein [Basidiobolus meristosporus CBS 931.73]|uniref:DUF1671-domain-containing protein n=1 Tax=Basidiobolus meristosporus CBS 931.73 TaxID=1314790 RepID=A0A1Y1X140_9FUNG|nr:DUF1671-domain-containing protein [Basidiobolus meristosporus CBS 931.73]|eukprot:ORX79517.1 DUF1671-domain-containing protein [Basidiobolus meristosporus CBS 931.73]